MPAPLSYESAKNSIKNFLFIIGSTVYPEFCLHTPRAFSKNQFYGLKGQENFFKKKDFHSTHRINHPFYLLRNGNKIILNSIIFINKYFLIINLVGKII